MPDPSTYVPAFPDPADTEAVAQDLLQRIDHQLEALRICGCSPFDDAKNLLAIQLIGPVILKIQGVEDTTGPMTQIALVVDSLNLEPLIAKYAK